MLGVKKLFCNQKRQRFARIFAVLSMFIVMASAAIFSCLDWQMISDEVNASDYRPSAEIAAIAEELQLTRRGRAAFYATRPELKTGAAFRADCGNASAGAYMSGCYLPGENERIALRATSADVLNENGVFFDFVTERQVTALHELLHAVYARLNEHERAAACREAKALAGSLAGLNEALRYYSGEQYCTELFARVGAEHADTLAESSTLAAAYGRYFAINPQLLERHRQNEAQLAELRTRTDRYLAQMKTAKRNLDDRIAQYYSSLNWDIYYDVNARIDDYNEMLSDYSSLASTYRKIVSALDSEQ